jgi:hypothetical protein
MPGFTAGVEVGSEFPSVRAVTTGTISGTGTVTNSTPRTSLGVDANWTSSPVMTPFFPLRFGGSVYVGLPIDGDSIASGMTTGGFTEQVQISNNAPVVVPSFFTSVPVAPGTNLSLGGGAWIENVKETVSLASGTFKESDSRNIALIRPFLSGTLGLNLNTLFPGVPALRHDELKLTGGYIFPTASTGQANFCAGGLSCIRTQEQGSFFVGASFNVSFVPPGVAPPPPH